jgi:hypothetical protein
LDEIRLAASQVDNGIYGGAIANVGEVFYRLHDLVTGRALVQVSHPQGTGVKLKKLFFHQAID